MICVSTKFEVNLTTTAASVVVPNMILVLSSLHDCCKCYMLFYFQKNKVLKKYRPFSYCPAFCALICLVISPCTQLILVHKMSACFLRNCVNENINISGKTVILPVATGTCKVSMTVSTGSQVSTQEVAQTNISAIPFSYVVNLFFILPLKLCLKFK